MHKNKSVIYVNYSPYENSGHILDYLNDNFKSVFLFSIAFHPLRGRNKLNKVTYFENGRPIKNIELYYMQVTPSLVWILISIRSILNAFQMIKQSLIIYRKYGKIDYFFSVNAFAVAVGILLQKLGIVRKTVFWVWDYYPMNHPSWSVKISRWLYWQFDKIATYADRVVYLNNRLAGVRIEKGLISKKSKYFIAPIGMGEVSPKRNKNLDKIRIGFIGVLKRSQGIDMLMDSAEYLSTHFKDLTYEIIGSGPDELYFKNLAKRSPVKFNFYGWVTETKFRSILLNCTLGIAPYTPEDSNVSRYGDPGKIKRYMEFNLPAIMTDVFEFSQELEKSGAGIVIEYGNAKQLVRSIKTILSDYNTFVDNTIKLHNKFYFRNIYKVMFD
jgi:glycosyltransferase involved in cell wall biosynthesis